MSEIETTRRRWTEAEDAKLRSRLYEGCTMADLCYDLGRRNNAIRLRIHKLRSERDPSLPQPIRTRAAPRKWTAVDDDRLVERRRAGATWRELARELERTEIAVKVRAEAIDSDYEPPEAWDPRNDVVAPGEAAVIWLIAMKNVRGAEVRSAGGAA